MRLRVSREDCTESLYAALIAIRHERNTSFPLKTACFTTVLKGSSLILERDGNQAFQLVLQGLPAVSQNNFPWCRPGAEVRNRKKISRSGSNSDRRGNLFTPFLLFSFFLQCLV